MHLVEFGAITLQEKNQPNNLQKTDDCSRTKIICIRDTKTRILMMKKFVSGMEKGIVFTPYVPILFDLFKDVEIVLDYDYYKLLLSQLNYVFKQDILATTNIQKKTSFYICNKNGMKDCTLAKERIIRVINELTTSNPVPNHN